MNQREAERMLSTLRGELAAADKRTAALHKVIEGITELYPDLDSGGKGVADKPRTQDAIREIMVGSAGKWFTPKLMVSELEQRGWLPDSAGDPTGAVRTAMTRLADIDPAISRGTGEKTKSVTYSYRLRDEPPATIHPMWAEAEVSDRSQNEPEAASS